tara:strand:- start:3243 stop:3623 length:381 start_codon:yes stop_codon:yes gene_type:complete
MNFFDNILIKLSLISTIYVVVLIFVSPIVDHFFTSLEEDILIKETNFQILSEIILHVIVLTITWYFLHNSLKYILNKFLKINIKETTQTAIDFITALALVGLQKNLIDKFRYITVEHPFRIVDLYQ